MTKQSTTQLILGPLGAGRWGEKVWRIANSAELVEGGIGHWLFTRPGKPRSEHFAVLISRPSAVSVVASILVTAAILGGEDEDIAVLDEILKIDVRDRVNNSGHKNIDLSEFGSPEQETPAAVSSRAIIDREVEIIRQLAALLRERARFGLVRLHEHTLADAEVIEIMRREGLEVELFTPAR